MLAFLSELKQLTLCLYTLMGWNEFLVSICNYTQNIKSCTDKPILCLFGD